MPREAIGAVTINDPDQGTLPVSLYDQNGNALADNNGLRVAQNGGATINTGQITVAITATLIIAANPNRYSLTIKNTGTASLYVGTSTVTTATGHLVAAGETITFNSTAAIYGIVASGTLLVTYAEEAV